MKKKHGWNTWENYFRIHEKVLKTYQAHFPNHIPKYAVQIITEHYYVMRIEKLELITTKGTSIQINIEKEVEVQPGGRKPVARTEGYSYQAWIKGGNNLVRYCSPHKNHNQFHHKHDFTKNPAAIIQMEIDTWPHVSEFFDELINNF